MNRVSFDNYRHQAEFLKEAINKINKPLAQVADICRVDKRTLYDWRRGKYQITYEALKVLIKKTQISMPRNITILPEYWYVQKGARQGAITRNKMYGNPGTAEGRKKGGLASIQKFKVDPIYAKRVGFKLRKEIKYPKKSDLLAEFMGIMLGDGSINNNQAKVTLNSKTDKDYAIYIQKIIKKLFSIKVSLRIDRNALEIIIYSRNLVDFLIKCGLKLGDKIVNQIDVPKWVFYKKSFIKSCLRGLIDTDGGIYFHNHITKGIKYKNIGLCFTSHSLPLLGSVHRMLLMLGISSKSDRKRHIFIYGLTGIGKYLSKIGSSNPKHLSRVRSYKGPKS